MSKLKLLILVIMTLFSVIAVGQEDEFEKYFHALRREKLLPELDNIYRETPYLTLDEAQEKIREYIQEIDQIDFQGFGNGPYRDGPERDESIIGMISHEMELMARTLAIIFKTSEKEDPVGSYQLERFRPAVSQAVSKFVSKTADFNFIRLMATLGFTGVTSFLSLEDHHPLLTQKALYISFTALTLVATGIYKFIQWKKLPPEERPHRRLSHFFGSFFVEVVFSVIDYNVFMPLKRYIVRRYLINGLVSELIRKGFVNEQAARELTRLLPRFARGHQVDAELVALFKMCKMP